MNSRLIAMIEQMMEEAWGTAYAEMDAAERLAAAGCDEFVIMPHLEMAAEAEARFYALKSLAPSADPLGLGVKQ